MMWLLVHTFFFARPLPLDAARMLWTVDLVRAHTGGAAKGKDMLVNMGLYVAVPK